MCTRKNLTVVFVACSLVLAVAGSLKASFFDIYTEVPAGVYSQAPGVTVSYGLDNDCDGIIMSGFGTQVALSTLTETACDSFFDIFIEVTVGKSGGGGGTTYKGIARGHLHLVGSYLGNVAEEEKFSLTVTQFDIYGGVLPANIQIRESPTRASGGSHNYKPANGGYMVSSFFDIFTEISTDGGNSWTQADSSMQLDGGATMTQVQVGTTFDVHQDIYDQQNWPNDFHCEGLVNSSNGASPILTWHTDSAFSPPNGTFSYSITPTADPTTWQFTGNWSLIQGTSIPYCTVLHLGLTFSVDYKNVMIDLSGWWTKDGIRIGQAYPGQYANGGFVPMIGFRVDKDPTYRDFIRIANGNVVNPPGPRPIEISIQKMDLIAFPEGVTVNPDDLTEFGTSTWPWVPVQDSSGNLIGPSNPYYMVPDSFFDIFLEVAVPGKAKPITPIIIEPGGTLVGRQLVSFFNNSNQPESRYSFEIHQAPPEPQACCFPDGSCRDILSGQCIQQGGTPKGVGTTCATTICQVPQQACCLPDGSCAELPPGDCWRLKGVPQGAGSVCATTQCAPRQAEPNNLKWSQPPLPLDPNSWPLTFCGWDEESSGFFVTQKWKMVADDFRCIGPMPITSVHWWGSHVGWSNNTLPQPQPTGWQISFWSDMPQSPGGFSMPLQLLRQIFVPYTRVAIEYAGLDNFDLRPSDTCFKYHVQLLPNEYFWQKQYRDLTFNNIFWISIVAVYQDATIPQNQWGWKTRASHWMDDAVTFNLTAQPVPGQTLDPATVTPLKDQYATSYDTCFQLDTDPNWVKWQSPYDSPQAWNKYRDIPSYGVQQNNTVNPIVFAADDWLCTKRTPVTSIVWWGSYLDFKYEACHKGATIEPTKPDYFLLSIWTDAVADTNYPFSHPAKKIWEYAAYNYDEVLQGSDNWGLTGQTAGEAVYRYSVEVPDANRFCQNGVNTVYWLSVIAVYRNLPTANIWGWTNHPYRYNDSAVNGTPNAAGFQWTKLNNSDGTPMDMSFALFTDPTKCCPCPDFNRDGIIDFKDLRVFANNWLWIGLAGGYNTADLNCDGIVNFKDFAILGERWLLSCP